MYDDQPRTLGYPADGAMSNYYPDSPHLAKDEIDATDAATGSYLSLKNTRLRRAPKDGVVAHEILVASVDKQPVDGIKSPILVPGSDIQVAVLYGDHAESLQRICSSLDKALPFVGSQRRRDYLTKLVLSYRSGNMEIHKDAFIDWLADESPVVETWSGFLEPGRDPSGVRCEFEGLVALQDKSWSEGFSRLAGAAQDFILQLPWSGLGDNLDELGPFENDTFIRPSFVALRCA